VFPVVNRDGYTGDACLASESFKVPPTKGDAIIFYSMLEDGNLDEASLHGGCKVLQGEKYGANLWFWDKVRAFR
jgi:prolyl 4-hydroxylase